MGNRQVVQEVQWSSSTIEEHEAAVATKIQAAVEGILNARHGKPLTHLRIIASVKKELGELQTKTADKTYMERILVDVMECRTLQEGIMALSLQLDGLQEVHPLVRDIRKSVNGEVVQFMEAVDAVIVGAPSSPWLDCRNNLHMGGSNSISQSNLVSCNILKGMFSLDNSTYLEQFYEQQHDEGFNFAHNGVDGDVMPRSGRRNRSWLGFPTNAAGSSAMGHSGPEGMDYHSELEALLTLTAVVTIQSCFRGYIVRRSRPLMHLRNIADVRGKLRELRDQVSNRSIQSKLRSDEMERLKVTECITAMLLKLDSVQAVDHVVRDIRKSVSREVFKLAKSVDNLIRNIEIVEGDLTPVGDDTESESNKSLSDCQQGPVDNWRALPALKVFPKWKDLQAQALAIMSSGPFHRNISSRNTYDSTDIESPKNSQSIGGKLRPNVHATGAREMEFLSATSSSSPAHSQFDNRIPRRPAGRLPSIDENEVPATGEGGVHTMRTLGDDSNAENFDASDILMNEVMFVKNQQQEVGSMDSGVEHLAEENVRLRALLDQVLNFMEVQTSMLSNVAETNEKLEAENERLKKREEVWRKKSKSDV